MKTMGLADLRLVAPKQFPAAEAQWMAAHAVDVLVNSRTHETLADAIADCGAAFAFSARRREWEPQVLEVRPAAERALALGGRVAFVFGPERTGLENDELLACQYLVRIPAQGGSLNLAQAVQVAAYELFMASGPAAPKEKRGKIATVEDLEGLYAHLERAATVSGFLDPASNSKLRTRWRRLFSRAALEREEVNILRGLLNALEAPKSE